jgi:hypothetical protein
LRFCFVMSGLTRSHCSSDTVHDLIALMPQSLSWTYLSSKDIIYG